MLVKRALLIIVQANVVAENWASHNEGLITF